MRLTLLPLLAFVSLAIAAPSPNNFVVKDTINVPDSWVRRSSVAVDDRDITLHLGLAKRDQAGLEARLLSASDPTSPDYGKWLSRSEVRDYTAPAPETRDIVYRWLEAHGVQAHHVNKRGEAGNSISFSVPVRVAREMLGDADFAMYQHRETGEERLTTDSYSLPRDVAPHVDTIFSLANFGRGTAFRAPYAKVPKEAATAESPVSDLKVLASSDSSATPSSCQFDYVTTDCLRELYGMKDYKPSGKGQYIGISGFLDEYANFADLQTFLADQRSEAKGYNFTVQSIDGGKNTQSKPGEEANLDVQTVAGISYPIKSTYFTTAGSPPFKPDANTPTNTNEPYEVQLEYIADLDDLPSVLSTSYGDDEQTVPATYMERVCADIASITAQGVSMLYASGDYGVGTSGKCYSNDGKKTPMFLPAFPSTCPWVTSIGATMRFDPEVVTTKEASFIVSGAGFSNHFGRPKYQEEAVSAYVKKLGSDFKGLYNTSGRAYPDISGQGSRYKIAVGGEFAAISGTSASTPLLSSIIALLNDVRLAQGKSTLGFLNPWLYKLNGEGFNDITSGSATGCNTTGFPATSGWDAVTGFGTPKFEELKKLALDA